MNPPSDQLRRQLEHLARQAAALKERLKQTMEPEKQLRLQNEIAHTAQETARVRGALRAVTREENEGAG